MCNGSDLWAKDTYGNSPAKTQLGSAIGKELAIAVDFKARIDRVRVSRYNKLDVQKILSEYHASLIKRQYY